MSGTSQQSADTPTDPVVLVKTLCGDVPIALRHFHRRGAIHVEAGVFQLPYFDLDAVKAFATYLEKPSDPQSGNSNKPPKKEGDDESESCPELSDDAQADLFELAFVFKLSALTDNPNSAILDNPNQLARALLLLTDPTQYHSKFAHKVLAAARQHILDLPAAPSFAALDPTLLTHLLNNANLRVANENDIYQVVRQYLKVRHDRVQLAYHILNCIRVSHLDEFHRRGILEDLKTLPDGQRIATIAKLVFKDENRPRCYQRPANSERERILAQRVADKAAAAAKTVDPIFVHKNNREITKVKKSVSDCQVVKMFKPKQSKRAERRAQRAKQQAKDEEILRRILSGS